MWFELTLLRAWICRAALGVLYLGPRSTLSTGHLILGIRDWRTVPFANSHVFSPKAAISTPEHSERIPNSRSNAIEFRQSFEISRLLVLAIGVRNLPNCVVSTFSGLSAGLVDPKSSCRSILALRDLEPFGLASCLVVDILRGH